MPSWSSPRRYGRILGGTTWNRRSPIIAAASVATVPRLARADAAAATSLHANSLTLRTLSALVLAPIAVAAVWFGWPWLPLVTLIAGAGMAWEWARLCGAGSDGTIVAVLIAAIVLAIAAASIGKIAFAVGLSLGGGVIVFWAQRRRRVGDPYSLAL